MCLPALLALAVAGGGARAAEAVAPPVMYPATLWQGRGEAVVRVLNRMDSHVETLTVPVDGVGSYKTLHIAVHRCLDRPATLAADAAVSASVTDDTDPTTKFDGWMLANEPALSVFASPLYQIRVVSCEGDQRDPGVPPLPAPQVATRIVAAQPGSAQDQPGDSGDLSGAPGMIQMAPAAPAAPASRAPAAPPPSASAGASGGPMELAPPAGAAPAPAPGATGSAAHGPSSHGPLSLVPPAETPSSPADALPPPRPASGDE
ncbi:hypothetical protein AME01nite_30250 [Acidomonas methanolica NBRC 104435]|nr:hypothetical protein AME01nite_30250 [Acidomonas methanolica NBRC 104435]